MRRGRSVGVVLALAGAAAAASADRGHDLERLREAIAESRERVADYERRERGLLDTLEALDRALTLLERDVARARREARDSRAELEDLEARAGDLEARLAETRTAMRTRAVALYKSGRAGAVQMLFAADGLREFLSRVYALRRLLARDVALIDRHRQQSDALARARDRARDAATEHQRAARALDERSAELAGERRVKRRLVRELHADRALERAALVELETAARALEETLAQLPDVEEPEPLPGGPAFAALRGRLAPPVEAPIARRFGRVVDEEFRTETFHKGIAFAAPLGAEVRAVAAGRVRFAGWFRGYGKLVILDHGDAYFTVCGHLAQIDVAVGDAVRPGDRLGSVGETGSLAGPRLYFEIRRRDEPLDPAAWLATLDDGRKGG